MTVSNLAARAGRAANAEPQPVPWQGMLWVIWRQHRGLVAGVSAACCAAAAAMLILGLRIHHDYAVVAACRPAASPGCQGLYNFFNGTDWHQGQALHVAVQAAPVLLALFAGPSLLARELENRTFRYTWTQGIGRTRWTVAKLALLGSAFTVAALAVGALYGWFFAPFLTTQQLSDVSPAVFGTSLLPYAAWALTGFCLGTFLGMLLRRILAAMLATLLAYLGLAGLTWFSLRAHYPVHTYWAMQLFEAAWLLVLSAALVAGTLWLVRRHAE
ncbi:MAG TPA: hypothetical protein VHZ33_00480 [Trebonia sp.]|nr:hypothetical protein [Trebonia sp.]